MLTSAIEQVVLCPVSFSPESDGIYIAAAAYNSAGKMTGSYYFGEVTYGNSGECTLAGAGGSETVKFFKINEENIPVGEAVVVEVIK